MQAVAEEVVVVSSRVETPRGPWRVLPDLRPGKGPLAGLEAALTEARRRGLEGVLVLAADLPLADDETLRRVADSLTDGDAAVVAFAAADATTPPSAPAGETTAEGRGGGKPDFEPLCAVYRTDCLEVVQRLLDEGRHEARSLFETVGGRRVPVAPHALLNVNTPEALGRARSRIETREAPDGEAAP